MNEPRDTNTGEHPALTGESIGKYAQLFRTSDGAVVVEASTLEDLNRAVEDHINDSQARQTPLRIADHQQKHLLRSWLARTYPTSAVYESPYHVQIDSKSFACALVAGL